MNSSFKFILISIFLRFPRDFQLNSRLEAEQEEEEDRDETANLSMLFVSKFKNPWEQLSVSGRGRQCWSFPSLSDGSLSETLSLNF